MFGKGIQHIGARGQRIITILSAVILSAAMILANIGIYNRYRDNLIETEKGQLLTIARTIGTSLEQYVTLEIEKADLMLDSLGIIEEEQSGDAVSPGKIRDIASLMIRRSEGLYKACILIRGGETLFTLGEWTEPIPQAEKLKPGPAAILGKYQALSGWYEMLIGKKWHAEGGDLAILLSMDLSIVYEKIVRPVKIGNGGYSVVKDRSLAIIMHHAKNQIGMDALYDRQEMYPDLDLTSLSDWLDLQRRADEGTGILDSYVWDSPDLTPVRRIVAFTTIDILDEQWIVNSTLPISELSEPLRRMLTLMAALSILYLTAIVLIMVGITSAIRRGEAQKKEIEYLTEINRGMEAIARKNDEIRHYQRVQSMGMMSSHIAHEFNNYLTPVMVYGELLESDPSVSEDNRTIVQEMLKSVGQAAKLSRELLDFSRMDAGGRMTAIDLTRETAEAVSVVRQLVPARITFSAELSDHPAWVRGREGMMQHILMNLCKNAFSAMEETERKELQVSYTVSEASGSVSAVLTVSDTGCGIKTERLQDIFEPFYTTKGSSQGTGLGLSVVRSMVENAGGSIEVRSEEGLGTSFIMRFAAAESKEKLVGVSGGSEEGGRLKTICVCRSKKELAPWQKWLDSLDGDIQYTNHEAAVVARLQEDSHFCGRLIVENELLTMRGIDLAQIVKRGNSDIHVILLAHEDSAGQQWYLDNGILDEIKSAEA